MPQRKLPKGVQSLGDVARKGGKGGQILKNYRRQELSFEAPQSKIGLRRESSLGKLRGTKAFEQYPGLRVRHIYTEQPRYTKPEVVAMEKLPDIESRRLATEVRPTVQRPAMGPELMSSSGVKALARTASKAGKLLGVAGLPLQYLEYREMMKKPRLHEREQKASAKSM